MGPGKRVTVARVAGWYSVLWLLENLGFQTGSGFLVGLPGTGLQPLLYCRYMTYTMTCLRVCHLLEIRYDVTSRATAVGG